MPRDYHEEWLKYKSKPEQKAKTAARNRARRLAIKEGLIQPGSPLDIDHKDGNALNNNPKNIHAESAHANRSYPRTKTARKKNPKD
jgi:hypothetical protein